MSLTHFMQLTLEGTPTHDGDATPPLDGVPAETHLPAASLRVERDPLSGQRLPQRTSGSGPFHARVYVNISPSAPSSLLLGEPRGQPGRLGQHRPHGV